MNPSSPSADPTPSPRGEGRGAPHVLFVDPTFRTADQAGKTRTNDLASHLAQNGFRCSILTTCDDPHPAPHEGLSVITVTTKSAGYGFDAPVAFARGFTFGALFKIWRAKGVDAVVAVDRPLRILPLVAAFAVWRGIPLILDVRTGLPVARPKNASVGQRCAAFCTRWLFRAATAFAGKVTAVTPALEEALTEDDVPESKVALSLLGCDTKTFAATGEPPPLATALIDVAQPPYVVFAGTMTPERRLERLIDIIAAMPDRAARFLLCGDGPSRGHLEARAQEKGLLNTNVFFPGTVARRDIATLLRFATAAVTDCTPHAHGGFLLDALAAGKPVALMGHGWQRDITEGRGAGISLDPNDPAAAGHDLADFLRDTDGLRRAGQQAAALAAGRFNLDRIAGEFRALVQDTIAADPREAVLRRRALRAKRALDIVTAFTGLIVLAPVMAGIAIAVRLQLGGPVLFKQNRTGLHGRFFTLVKFRTMTTDKGNDGQLLGDASRLTPFGRFLRRTSLDELPELFNVLMGDMSLVGPRPLLPEYLPYYDAVQRRRHEVKPGLTGWAQVNGRNATSWEERFTLDVWYVDHFSFGLDLKILAKTAWVALTGRGINADGHATMPRFDEVMARRQGAEDV